MALLTSTFCLTPEVIPDLYRLCGQAELLFTVIKRDLRIKVCFRTSERAVKVQILIATTKKRLHLAHHSVKEIPRILSLSMLETILINQLLTQPR